MLTRGGIAAALGALALVAGITAASAAGDRPRPAMATAEAFAREGESGALSGYVQVRDDGRASGRGTRVSASTAGARGVALATAELADVELFDGLVTAGQLTVSASAKGGRTTTTGSVRALRIGGRLVRPPRGRTAYDMGGVGKLVALASGRTGILGLRGTLTEDYRGWKAGDAITVGYVSARARDGVERTGSSETGTPGPALELRPERGERRRMSERRRRRAERLRLAAARDALLARRGYAFPVAGDASFRNDWGAPRPTIPGGAHQGNDIFAPIGTPVVAVADGRVYRVGTRRISGNRLWLRDRAGHRYFYAHLADFAAAAFNGADVRAGEVLGFVGNTGDAEPTPPHLHFEVHLPDGAAINPFRILTTWRRRGDVKPGAAPSAPPPGALVVVRDFLDRR